MNFLFNSPMGGDISKKISLSSQDNKRNIFSNDRDPSYVVYKSNSANYDLYNQSGTELIKNHLTSKIYTGSNENPYIKLWRDFDTIPGLRIKASDLAYLRYLGVYPMNRMVILRRFTEGQIIPADLTEVKFEPISTVIGWVPPEEGFGQISFNETWETTSSRFDVLLRKILAKEIFGVEDDTKMELMPIPGFAQGLVFELFNKAGLTTQNDEFSNWNSSNLPIGDPNMLQEGPYRDPNKQNLKSAFNFKFETTYEQKLIGDVDPGSAMIDIIDNLLAMGTSNVKYWWSEQSKVMIEAKRAASGTGNSYEQWYAFIKAILTSFLNGISGLIKGAKDMLKDTKNAAMASGTTFTDKMSDLFDPKSGELRTTIMSVLSSTVAKWRWEMRGSIELMVGGGDSSTPWYLTIGNPSSPWLATNHIVVNSITVSTSPEMGFNDQPLWLKAEIDCVLSRNLGKQEILRMFNNNFMRKYSEPNSQMSQKINSSPPIVNSDAPIPGANPSPIEATFDDEVPTPTKVKTKMTMEEYAEANGYEVVSSDDLEDKVLTSKSGSGVSKNNGASQSKSF